jgi:hypothetical protein
LSKEKTIMIKLFFSIIILIYFVGCKKDSNEINLPISIKYPAMSCLRKTNHIDTVKTMIIGTYDWAYTFYRPWRQDAQIWTPQNQGLNYRYIFKSNKEVEYYENSMLQWTNKYVVDYEFKVSTYQLDSATMVIINDKSSGQRIQYFRAYLCNDSARFYNPYSSIDVVRYFGRK